MGTHSHGKREKNPSSIQSNPKVPSTITEVPEPTKEEKHEVVLDALKDIGATTTVGSTSDGPSNVPLEEVKTRKKWTRRTQAQIAADNAKSSFAPVDNLKLEEAKASFAAMGEVLLEWGSKRMPNPIPASEEEKKLFSNAVSRVIEKYYPQLNGYDPELALAFAIGVVLLPRLKRPEPKLVPRKIMTQAEVDAEFEKTKLKES